jgi:hypothetical protein
VGFGGNNGLGGNQDRGNNGLGGHHDHWFGLSTYVIPSNICMLDSAVTYEALILKWIDSSIIVGKGGKDRKNGVSDVH